MPKYNISRSKSSIGIEWGIDLPTRYTVRYGKVGEDNLMIDSGLVISTDSYANTHFIEITDLDAATRYMIDAALFNEDGQIVDTRSTIVTTYANIGYTQTNQSIGDTSITIYATTDVPCKSKVNILPRGTTQYNNDSFSTTHVMAVNALRDNTSYLFDLVFEDENGGEIVIQKQYKTRPSITNENILTLPYKCLIAAIKLNGAKTVLARINEEIMTRQLTSKPMSVPQIIAFSNMVFGLYMDSGANTDRFIRMFAIWMLCDNIIPELTREQKLEILQIATGIAKGMLAVQHKNGIVEHIERLNEIACVLPGDEYCALYRAVTGVDLSVVDKLNYESSV